jgi:hypothetical protein
MKPHYDYSYNSNALTPWDIYSQLPASTLASSQVSGQAQGQARLDAIERQLNMLIQWASSQQARAKQEPRVESIYHHPVDSTYPRVAIWVLVALVSVLVVIAIVSLAKKQ